MTKQKLLNRIKPSFYVIIMCFSVLYAQNTTAQIGKFLQLWGGPQLVKIDNDNNYSLAYAQSGELNVTNTYRTGFGIDYIDNFNQNYGFQTGIYYCGQGQKFFGSVSDIDVHMPDSVKVPYTSKLLLDYIKIPVYVRFNSIIPDQSRLNVSIFFGFYLGYLLDLKSYTNVQGIPGGIPDTLLAKFPNYKLKPLYNTFDFGLGAGAQFNVKLTEKMYINLGVRFDRSITDIENYNTALPADAPSEWNYPVSTPKSIRTAQLTQATNPASQNISLNVYLGLTFKVKDVAERKHEPRDNQDNQE